MNATIPPMHAALSVLGTMAGQYLAAQGQTPPPPPPAPANATTQQSTGTAAQPMCHVCALYEVKLTIRELTPC
jgi:hypothetical protein